MTTIAMAILMGIVVLLAGNLPWGVLLVPLNLRFARVVPWAVLPMAIYLDAAFLLSAAAFAVLAGLTWWAYVGFTRSAHVTRT